VGLQAEAPEPSGATHSTTLRQRAGLQPPRRGVLRRRLAPAVPVNAHTPSVDPAEALPPAAPAHLSWARLLKRVFEIDLEHCPHCGGPLTIIAAIEHLSVNVFNDFYILLFGRGRPLDPWDDKPAGERGSPRPAPINPNGCWGP
jgi:hypothetical protein